MKINTNRIILVIDGFGHGGIQQVYKVLIREYCKVFDFVFLIIIDSNISDLKIEKIFNLKIIRLESKKLIDFNNFFEFKKIITSIGPSIIIASIYRSQIWSAIAKPRKTKLIWVEQNTHIERPKLHWQLMRILVKRVDKLVGSSDDVRNLTEFKLNKKTIVIPNPLTGVGRYNLSSKRQNDFVFIARMISQKNPELMLRSYSEYIKLYGTNSKLHMVGGGELLKSLELLSKELNLESRCIFHNFMSNEQIQELLSQSKTLVSTSIIEGMPLVRTEALANGCCVVSTNTGGNHFFKHLESSGVFVVDSDVSKIAQKMHESIDPKYWTQKFIDTRASIVEDFKAKNISAKLISFNLS
jgi:glycosyltransferase involved in cell wall biosynthesis